jgi:hypothetical protein
VDAAISLTSANADPKEYLADLPQIMARTIPSLPYNSFVNNANLTEVRANAAHCHAWVTLQSKCWYRRCAASPWVASREASQSSTGRRSCGASAAWRRVRIRTQSRSSSTVPTENSISVIKGEVKWLRKAHHSACRSVIPSPATKTGTCPLLGRRGSRRWAFVHLDSYIN